MFVSVQEQRFAIGLQKALGAKKWLILTQFLAEATLLGVAGGGLGLFATYLTSFVEVNNFSLIITRQNVCLAFGISFFTGLLSGLIPAHRAATLDPVRALKN